MAPDVKPDLESGDAGLAYLAELEPDVRAAGIFGPDGSPVATSAPDLPGFLEAAPQLLQAVGEASGGEREVDSCHVALENGEVFMVREAGMTMIAVTDRFVLASLTAFDMRMTLRDFLETGENSA
jgi:hypothetical protein